MDLICSWLIVELDNGSGLRFIASSIELYHQLGTVQEIRWRLGDKTRACLSCHCPFSICGAVVTVAKFEPVLPLLKIGKDKKRGGIQLTSFLVVRGVSAWVRVQLGMLMLRVSMVPGTQPETGKPVPPWILQTNHPASA